jgi:hypothetical protein
MRVVGEQIPSVVEMSGKAEVETGASEQQWPHNNEEAALSNMPLNRGS